MITHEQAKEKIKLIDPRIPADVHAFLVDILDRKSVISQDNHDDTIVGKKAIHWIENRLAQPHLGYLAPDQVNEIWGGSTTTALIRLGQRYQFKFSGIIGADTLAAVLDGTRPNEEPIPKANTYDWVKFMAGKAKGPWFDKPNKINIVAVRGYMLPNGKVENIGNRFNDTFFLAWIDKNGNKRVKAYVGSVDPGLYYYSTNPINPIGCAHLDFGVWDYETGFHKGHPAFTQAAPFRVARTNSANFTKRTYRDTGFFGINIHPAFAFGGVDTVDSSSAGCQTPKAAGWNDPIWIDFRETMYLDPDKKYKYILTEA